MWACISQNVYSQSVNRVLILKMPLTCLLTKKQNFLQTHIKQEMMHMRMMKNRKKKLLRLTRRFIKAILKLCRYGKRQKNGVSTSLTVFITSEGNPTYEGKELGIAELEFRDYPDIDKCIHVVAPEQASFFAVTFKVEELLDPGKYMEKQYHFPYGYVRLTSGKMSSRKGTIVLGEWLMDEVVKKITEKFTNVSSSAAEIIAVGAVKYSFLKIDSRQDISFD